jgi:hypothetical protein
MGTNCYNFCHNNSFGGSAYVSGTTCDGVVAAYTLTLGQCICMDLDFPIITCENPIFSGACAPNPTPSITPTLTPSPTATNNAVCNYSITLSGYSNPTYDGVYEYNNIGYYSCCFSLNQGLQLFGQSYILYKKPGVNNWIVYSSITSKWIVIGPSLLPANPLEDDTISIGGFNYPQAGTTTSGAYLSYPAICPTLTPSATATPTMTQTNTNTPTNTATPSPTPCVCESYRIASGGFPGTATWTNCDGTSGSQFIDSFQQITICACLGSVSAPGLFITDLGLCITPTPTATPTITPTNTQTSTPTSTPVTTTPTITPTNTGTPTSTPQTTSSPTPSVTATNTGTPTSTPQTTSSPTPSVTATNTATPTNTQTSTPTGTLSITSTPTNTSTPTPTSFTQFGGSGYGNTVSDACNDALINNRTFYSNCDGLTLGVGCFVYVSPGTPLTGYTNIFMNFTSWDINSSTGEITAVSSVQC